MSFFSWIAVIYNRRRKQHFIIALLYTTKIGSVERGICPIAELYLLRLSTLIS